MDRITQRLRREGGDGGEHLTDKERRFGDVCAATHGVYSTVVVNFPDVADLAEAKRGVHMDVSSSEEPDQPNSNYLDYLADRRAPVVPAHLDRHVVFDPNIDMRQAA